MKRWRHHITLPFIFEKSREEHQFDSFVQTARPSLCCINYFHRVLRVNHFDETIWEMHV